MNLIFYPESSHVQLSSNLGMTLSFGLKLKPDSDSFALNSGISLKECIFNLTVHPQSQSPYADKHELDGRLGECSPLMSAPSEKNNIYMMWLHIPDDQFNTLLFETSRQNLPTAIEIGFDDESNGLSEGVYDDMYPSIREGGGKLPVRFFLFTVKLAGER